MKPMSLPPEFLHGVEYLSLTESETFYSRSCNLFITFEGSLSVETGSFRSDAPVVLCFSKENFLLTPGHSCIYALIRLDPVLTAEYLGYHILVNPCDRFSTRSSLQLKELVHSLLSMNYGAERNDFKYSSYLFAILSILNSSSDASLTVNPPLIPLSPHRKKLYHSLMLWIHSHCAAGTTQAKCAAYFDLTPQYLGKFLQETTGMSYRECMITALSEQKEVLKSIKDTGTQEETRPPGIPIGRLASISAKNSSEDIREYHFRAIIDPRQSFPQYWRTLINLGYAINLRSQNLDSALGRTFRELGFRYARICRITDLITESRTSGRYFYDFSSVFGLLDSLITRGIIPFLELGNKAFRIQETTDINLSPVSPTASKDYYQHLLNVLPHFLRACINHYGQENIDTWCFEISFMYTDEAEREQFGIVQYAAVFRKIYQLIRAFSPSCKIGGPGFNDWSDDRKIRQAVQLITSHGIKPDFFSAYSYPIKVVENSRSRISDDGSLGFMRIRTFTEIARSMVPGCEIWITEFNSNLSSRNYLNDSVYQSVYIARLILAVSTLKINALAYYLLSDTPLRYLDSLDFLFGGWGLISDRDIPKPSFHAFRLLSMLGHYRIRLSENCVITANSTGSFQILLFHYDHPTEQFLTENVSRDDLLLPHVVFSSSGEDHFRIRIENAQRGIYIMRIYRIDAMHASLFFSWREFGLLNPPNMSSIRELEQKSALIPAISIQKLEADEIFTTEQILRGNELVLITMELFTSRIDTLP